MINRAFLRRGATVTLMRLAGLCVVLSLAGCVDHRTPIEAWYKPGTPTSATDSQRTIDAAECTAYAIHAVPIPIQESAPINPQASKPSGNYRVIGSVNGMPYQATVQEQPSDSTEQAILAGQQMAEANERAHREAVQYAAATHAQNQLADACMMKRGWIKSTSTNQE